MNMKFLFGMVILALFIGAGYGASTNAGKVVLVRLLATDSVVNKFEPPAKTNWKPEGVRTTGEVSETHGWQTTYARTIHTDTHSSDETPLAISPMFELDWITEPTMFVAEGPVFDREGNIYFSPIFPPEEVILVSLEPNEGKRRWVYEGISAGAGTPFIYSGKGYLSFRENYRKLSRKPDRKPENP